MKKGVILKENRNLINEIFILKVLNKQNKFLYNFVGTKKELIKFLSKNEKIKLSENIFLSEMFLNDLIDFKFNNKDFIYL